MSIKPIKQKTVSNAGSEVHVTRPTTVSPTGLLQAGSAIFVLCWLTSMLGHFHHYLELLSHFRMQFFVCAVLLALCLFAVRQFRWFSILFILSIIDGSFIAPWYFEKPVPLIRSLAAPLNLRVAQVNVLSSNKNTEAFIHFIGVTSPDIVVIQEVNKRWGKVIESLKAAYPHQVIQTREDNFGLALISKYPLINPAWTHWGNADVPSISTKIEIAGTHIHVLASHPLPPVSKHYFMARNRQLVEIATAAKAISSPVVLIGDLNTSMWSSHYIQLEKASGLRNARLGKGILPTWPSQYLLAMIPIDHCLVSAHFSVDRIFTGNNIGSDHLPLVADLILSGS